MYALSNVFMREEKPEQYDSDRLVHSFTLLFSGKERRFYNLNEADHKLWMQKL